MKFLALLLVVFLSACGTGSTSEKQTVTSTETKSTPVVSSLTSAAVLAKFKEAGMPITKEKVYTAENDTNNLLGRPNQYTEKINFSDKRTEANAPELGNSIEIFKTPEDLEKRKAYAENISKSGGIFLQYIYSHKNVLLRLDHQFLPKDAEQYQAILNEL